MLQAPLRLALIARDRQERVQAHLRDLQENLQKCSGVEITGIFVDENEIPKPDETDIAIVLGGDGAILRACRSFGEFQIPILGVNLGRLGFLADLTPDEFNQRISELEARHYTIVSHLMFECTHKHAAGGQDEYLGLNEVALLAGASLQMIDIDLAIDRERVTTFSGDGLIISTPVGSTAHNLSAGGPILRQDLKAFVITPICPHTLTIRPIIDRSHAEYVLRIDHAPDGVMLVVDGQIKVPFKAGDEVIVRASTVEFDLVRLPGFGFYGTLHRKLGWHGQPQYQRAHREPNDHQH